MQDDSVFADFDVDEEGCVRLVRISFDGYGCCRTADNISSMSPEMSSKWIDLVEANNVTSEDLSGILSKYFRENRDVIWEDALLEHELLND
ncbi:MAG: hypothetical protein KIT61_08685 [Pyrinomonadaceae bacterium]|nr:hypothetical protein [Pyrinomonadaceae bacterium]